MPRLVAFALATVAAAAVTAAARQTAAPQQPLFRSNVQTVGIYATVNDRDGRLVPDLTRDDFQVLDNGKPAELAVFSNDIQVITVALLLDMSGSMVARTIRVRDASIAFVNALLPNDRARIGTFGEEVAISPFLTGDKAVLERILHEELWPGGGTPLWRAIDAGMTSLAGEQGRRVVLTVTDGFDTGPGGSYGHVRQRAIAERFMVYAVGLQGTGLGGSGVTMTGSGIVIAPATGGSAGTATPATSGSVLAGDMTDLAEQTGGGHSIVNDSDDLTAALARVADELRHQYLLGFTPSALDGKIHKLEVRMLRDGMKARAPKSYLAVADK